MTKKGNLQQGLFIWKREKLEWLMAVILLSAAYVHPAREYGWWQHRRQPQK